MSIDTQRRMTRILTIRPEGAHSKAMSLDNKRVGKRHVLPRLPLQVLAGWSKRRESEVALRGGRDLNPIITSRFLVASAAVNFSIFADAFYRQPKLGGASAEGRADCTLHYPGHAARKGRLKGGLCEEIFC